MNTTVTDQIIQLAGRPGGIGSGDLPGIKSEDVSARCCGLVRRGILFRAGSGRGNVRYFTTEEAAQAHDNAKKPAVTISQRMVKASWSKVAETVITSETKVTICPPWQPRFQAVDLPCVHAANQRGRA